MRVVLWDTRKRDVTKDYAGGLGVGMYHGKGGLRGQLVRRFFTRDRRPVALNFAYMAAVFKKLGHDVQYCQDTIVPGADLYVFNPAMLTLDVECEAIRQVRAQSPQSRIFIVGTFAHSVPQAFTDLDATIIRGEPEQLYWKLDDALNAPDQIVDIGTVDDLDALPWPDWSPFKPRQFRIAYDFWKFPSTFIYDSRGCNLSCNYCPYIIVKNETRFRDPEQVVAEIEYGMKRHGFRSFKFRDPLFGLNRKRLGRLIEGLGKLPGKIQFSVETRTELLKPRVLSELKRVGLTSVTVGVERPDGDTLRRHNRAPTKSDRQHEFIARCRKLGIRVVTGFMVGFPNDTQASIYRVLDYARQLNPTFANFNVVTPYPGTGFFEKVKDQVADSDFNNYSVYHPVMKYKFLTADQVAELHMKCFTKFYFRSKYYWENLHLLFPVLQRFGVGIEPLAEPSTVQHRKAPPATSHRLPVIQHKHESPAGTGGTTSEDDGDRAAAA